MTTKLKVLLTLTSLAFLTAVQGKTVITPTSAISSSTIAGTTRTITETINGVGLSGVGDILTKKHILNNGENPGYWLSANTGGKVDTIVLTFALSEATTVNAVHLWNYERDTNTSRGIASFDISFSTDGVNFSATPISITGVTEGDAVDSISVQSFSFPAQSNVTHIRITKIANHGDANYVGLSEIRLGAIPEPSSKHPSSP